MCRWSPDGVASHACPQTRIHAFRPLVREPLADRIVVARMERNCNYRDRQLVYQPAPAWSATGDAVLHLKPSGPTRLYAQRVIGRRTRSGFRCVSRPVWTLTRLGVGRWDALRVRDLHGDPRTCGRWLVPAQRCARPELRPIQTGLQVKKLSRRLTAMAPLRLERERASHTLPPAAPTGIRAGSRQAQATTSLHSSRPTDVRSRSIVAVRIARYLVLPLDEGAAAGDEGRPRMLSAPFERPTEARRSRLFGSPWCGSCRAHCRRSWGQPVRRTYMGSGRAAPRRLIAYTDELVMTAISPREPRLGSAAHRVRHDRHAPRRRAGVLGAVTSRSTTSRDMTPGEPMLVRARAGGKPTLLLRFGCPMSLLPPALGAGRRSHVLMIETAQSQVW